MKNKTSTPIDRKNPPDNGYPKQHYPKPIMEGAVTRTPMPSPMPTGQRYPGYGK